MSSQILLKSLAAVEDISKDELSFLELELYSQLESIKLELTQGCTEKIQNTFAELLKYAKVVV